MKSLTEKQAIKLLQQGKLFVISIYDGGKIGKQPVPYKVYKSLERQNLLQEYDRDKEFLVYSLKKKED